MKQYTRYFLCGLAMGAADTVPGVSGGTIAFITGIYENLLNAIKSVNIKFLKLFFKGDFKKALTLVPFDFLIPLLLGIGIAIFSLANLVIYSLENYNSFIYAFFFGLILASTALLGIEIRKIKKQKSVSLILGILGALFAIWISFFNPISLEHNALTLFLSGMIAICAMILPGISGSFILLLLGQYHFIMEAVSSFNIPVLLVFASGCVVGLLSFAHILSLCLKKFYASTIALLTGILAGSLCMVFPFTMDMLKDVQELLTHIGFVGLGLALPLLLHKASKYN